MQYKPHRVMLVYALSCQCLCRRCFWRARPNGGPAMLLTVHISPASVMMYAVFPMISSEVGRSSPSAMTLNVPSALTLSSEPVFGSAGEPSGLPLKSPCERAKRVWPRPDSTSTTSGAPDATVVTEDELGPNDTTLPVSGR